MISVIVPAFNESAGIAQCLASLAAQRLPADAFEVIVVDNGSSDDTVALARRFTPHILTIPGVTVATLRNRGIAHARGEVLAFLDADCRAAPDWLSGARAALAEGGVAVGNVYDLPADAGWIETLWFGGVAPGRWQTGELWSGNLVALRTDVDACGGFDESLVSSEDIVLTHALAQRGPLFCDPRVRVTHLGGPRNLLEFARQQLWHGFEEWTLYRRGIHRSTFAPTMAMLAGYVVAAVGVVVLALRPVAVLMLGGSVIWFLVPLLRQRRPVSLSRTVRLGVLTAVSLSLRAASTVIRLVGLHWSGRRKRIQSAG